MAIRKGMAAGAVGTVALNVATYLDMLIRGRPSSQVPSKVAGKLTGAAGVELGGGGEEAENRQSSLGSLFGYVTGLGVGALYGLIRPRLDSPPVVLSGTALGLAAMAGSDIPAVALGVTDPKEWGAKGWASDVLPHLAYGVFTALAYEALDSD